MKLSNATFLSANPCKKQYYVREDNKSGSDGKPPKNTVRAISPALPICSLVLSSKNKNRSLKKFRFFLFSMRFCEAFDKLHIFYYRGNIGVYAFAEACFFEDKVLIYFFWLAKELCAVFVEKFFEKFLALRH